MKKFSVLLAILFLSLLSCTKESETPTEKTLDRTANLMGPGDSANEFLSDSKFKNLKIEIGYVTGFKPTDSAISEFTSMLSERIHKDNIAITYQELPSPGKDSLSVQEIFELEQEHRSVYNNGDTLGLYIYFSDAPSDNDKAEDDLVTLGAVYKNTSMVIYEATIRKLASRSMLISSAQVEAATLSHEAGHLFGLVNLGTPMVNEHHDPEAEHHCIEDNCLMRAELQFGGGIAKMLASKGGRTPGFGVECILDLRANGGK